MKIKLAIALAIIAILTATAVATMGPPERERDRIRDREHVPDFDKQKAASEGPIYGHSLLSAQERNQYREQMRSIDSGADRRQFIARHREEMRARAKAQGIPFNKLEETEEAE